MSDESPTTSTGNKAAVYPRGVIEGALRCRAFALVLVDNHPNGVATPTEQDKMLTRAIALAAETVNVRVIDHLIVSIEQVFSFRKAGIL
jgi:DNA repair protein RadC